MSNGEILHNPGGDEASRRPDIDYFDFTNASPEEFVQLHRDIHQLTDGDEGTLLVELLDGYATGLEVLCTQAPDQAAANLAALASEMENKDARDMAAGFMPRLARVNQEAALPIWAKLMEDPDDDVARVARDAIEDVAEKGSRSLSLPQIIYLLRVGQKRGSHS